MSTAVPPPPKTKRSWFRKKRYNIPIGVVTALVLIGSFSDDATEVPVTPASNSEAIAFATKTVTAEPEPTADGSKEPTAEETATQTPKPKPKVKPAPKPVRTYLVSRVIDGDTVELGNGDAVRVVGIDTPERGECGYEKATANMEGLVLGKQVRLAVSDEDHDRYGLLRYLNVGGKDAGLRQIKSGLAIARYDSRDGYGEHPREASYIAADKHPPSKSSCPPKPAPAPAPARAQQSSDCMSGYEPCLPVTGDLNCPDVDGPITVTGDDPYRLDQDGDGTACE